MAFNYPHLKITEIPNTHPAATPGLWNFRYQQIDENFERIKAFNPVAECKTAAATVEKVADCPFFVLALNSFVLVRFTATNTATNPTLNVNGTGAKPVHYRGKAIPTSQLQANRAYMFVFDGSAWVLVGDIDSGTDYLSVKGGTVTGAVSFTSAVTVIDPTQPKHPVTKSFMENSIGSAIANLKTGLNLEGKLNTIDGVYQAITQFNQENGI